MTKKNQTKRALISSVIALVLCFSMLVGTTFAWFTDSVSSAKNQIVAGNLDVELKYSTDMKNWNALETDTNVFSATYWEPGHTEVVYLKISNLGSLALKYQLGVNIVSETSGINVEDKPFQLSKYIKYDVVAVNAAYASREAAVVAATNSKVLNGNPYVSETAALEPVAGTTVDFDTVALIVYMPESVGNEANYKTGTTAPSITLGINLVATQEDADFEKDSFGNSYDANATYPVISYPAVLPEAGAAAQDTTLSASSKDAQGNAVAGAAVTVPAAAINNIMQNLGDKVTSIALAHSEPKADAAAKTITFDAIDIVDQNGNPIDLAAIGNDAEIAVTLPAQDVFLEGETVVIYHDGVAVASAVVKADGTLAYEVTHFCEVVLSYADQTIDSEYELVAALAKGGAYKLGADIVLNDTVMVPQGVVAELDLNGHSLSTVAVETVYAINNHGTLTLLDSKGEGSVNARGIYNGYDATGNNNHVSTAVITIKNGNYNAKGTNGGAVVFNYGTANIQSGNLTSVGGYTLNNQPSGTMIVENVTVTGGIFNNGNLTINSGNIATNRGGYTHAVYSENGSLVINGGTFSGNGNEVVNANKDVAIINGGTFQKVEKTSYLMAGSNMVINGGTFLAHESNPAGHPVRPDVTVKGGKFNYKHTKIAAGYKIKEVENGMWEVSVAIKTGADLQNAVANAKNGDVITLVHDIEFTEGANGSTNGISCVGAASFTIDLNGNTISSNLGNNALRFKIGDGNDVKNTNVTITIKNGKLVSGSNNWCAISAATADNSGNKLTLNLENLEVEANKAGDYAIKSWQGATVNAKNVTVTGNYAGCFYAVGGEMVLDNCTAVQTGMHIEPYMSMAVAVSGMGKMTVNSGTYTATPAAASDGYNQGTSHGCWSAGVMNSGGTLIINGGTFTNGNFGEDNLATAARGLIFADTNGVVEVNGGTFNALKTICDFQNNLAGTSPVFTIKGGVYSADPIKVTSYGSVALAEGMIVVNNNGKYNVVEGVAVTNSEELTAAINSAPDGTSIYLAEGDYSVRFTNNTAFNVDNLTLIGVGQVNLTVSSSEAWYGRVQGSNVTFENIHFTSSVGATGKATYNNCVFGDWTICASSNKEQTYFNYCTINGCLNTSTDFSSGDVYVKNCEIVKAEYSGSMTMNFENCKIGEMVIWNANTNLTNCVVTTLDCSNVTDATIIVDGVEQ